MIGLTTLIYIRANLTNMYINLTCNIDFWIYVSWKILPLITVWEIITSWLATEKRFESLSWNIELQGVPYHIRLLTGSFFWTTIFYRDALPKFLKYLSISIRYNRTNSLLTTWRRNLDFLFNKELLLTICSENIHMLKLVRGFHWSSDFLLTNFQGLNSPVRHACLTWEKNISHMDP